MTNLRLALFWLGVVILALALLPLVLPDPDLTNPRLRNAGPFTAGHPLGTDVLGRDLFAWIILQMRQLFAATAATVAIAAVLSGVLAGLLLSLSPKLANHVSHALTGVLAIVIAVESIVLVRAAVRETDWQFGFLVLIPWCAFALALRQRGWGAFLPETLDRDRWTTFGWRLARLFVAFVFLFPLIRFIQIGLWRLEPPTSVTDYVPVFAVALLLTGLMVRYLLAQRSVADARLALFRTLPSAAAWSIIALELSNSVYGSGPSPTLTRMMTALEEGQDDVAVLVGIVFSLTFWSLLRVGSIKRQSNAV